MNWPAGPVATPTVAAGMSACGPEITKSIPPRISFRPSVGHAASEETWAESVQELRETLVRVTCRVDKITFFTY